MKSFSCILPILLWTLHRAVCKENSYKWKRINSTNTTYGTPMPVEVGPLSASQCLARCSATTGCVSVNVHRENLQCELLTDHPLNRSLSKYYRPGWSVYYTVCPDSWVQYLQSCYYFDENVVTNQQAQDVCTMLESSMIHVETVEEHDFLQNFMLTHFSNESSINSYSRCSFWLGLTLTSTKEWHWFDDGSVPNFTRWYPGEANGAVVEQCSVYHGDFVKYLWADVLCTRVFRTLCKKKFKLD